MSGDTLVNADTGEKIAECTPDEARELTDRICTGLGVVWELVLEAYRTRAWAALGHGSWDAYCAAEFGKFHMRLPSEERDEVIGSLRAAGLSIRAIAATGVASKKTVERTIAASGVANDDTCTVGTDGKTYDAVNRAKARKEAEQPPAEPGKCVDGFDCPSTPGPDGLCAWHRGRRKANEASDGSSSLSDEPEGSVPAPPAEFPGKAGAGETDAAATGCTDGDTPPSGAEGDGTGPSPSGPVTLPSDWRDRLACAVYFARLDPGLLRPVLDDDDRADLEALRDHLNAVLNQEPTT